MDINMLRKALWVFLKPLIQLITNLLNPEIGEEWLIELKKFLRKEPCWLDDKKLSESGSQTITVDKNGKKYRLERCLSGIIDRNHPLYGSIVDTIREISGGGLPLNGVKASYKWEIVHTDDNGSIQIMILDGIISNLGGFPFLIQVGRAGSNVYRMPGGTNRDFELLEDYWFRFGGFAFVLSE